MLGRICICFVLIEKIRLDSLSFAGRNLIMHLENTLPESSLKSLWLSVSTCVPIMAYVSMILICLKQSPKSLMFCLLVLLVTFPLMVYHLSPEVIRTLLPYHYWIAIINLGYALMLYANFHETVHFIKQIMLPFSLARVLFTVYSIITSDDICEDYLSCYAFNFTIVFLYCVVVTLITKIFNKTGNLLLILKDTLTRFVNWDICMFLIALKDSSRSGILYTITVPCLVCYSFQYYLPQTVDKLSKNYLETVVKFKNLDHLFIAVSSSCVLTALISIIYLVFTTCILSDRDFLINIDLRNINIFYIDVITYYIVIFLAYIYCTLVLYGLKLVGSVTMRNSWILAGVILSCWCIVTCQFYAFYAMFLAATDLNYTLVGFIWVPLLGLEAFRTLICIFKFMHISTYEFFSLFPSDLEEAISYYIKSFIDILGITSNILFLMSLLSVFQPDIAFNVPFHIYSRIKTLYNSLLKRKKGFQRIKHFETASRETLQRYEYTCSICTFDIKDGISTPCGHCFHRFCLKTWMYDHETCPYCRQVIL